MASIQDVSAQINRVPARDAQFWNDVQLSIPLKKSADGKKEKISLLFAGTLRIGRNVTHPVDERVAVGLEFKVAPRWTITPSFLYRAAQPYEGRKEYEHRLRFDATYEQKLGRFTFKDRNRLEYRIRAATPDSVRYRNRIQIGTPLKMKGKEILAPFIANELYYDFRQRKRSRNDAIIGVARKLGPDASVEIFYLYKVDNGTVLNHFNVVGTSFKLKIK